MENSGFACVECDKIYSSSSNLYKHARQKHNVENAVFQSKASLKCVICAETFCTKSLLEEHFLCHDIITKKEYHEFLSFNEFLKWKENIEKENCVLFVKHRGVKRKQENKVSSFYCHRSGTFESNSKGKRNVKMLGSNKIEGVCPAMMKVTETREKTVVEYTATHIGHTLDIGRMKLTNEEKTVLAAKLANKVPINAVLDDIRDSVGSSLERIHLLTRRDLLNIKSQFHIGSGIFDSSDVLSVHKWIEKMHNDQDSPVVCCKPQNVVLKKFSSLNKDNFMLVLMNADDDNLFIDECDNLEKETHIETLKQKRECNVGVLKEEIRSIFGDIGSEVDSSTSIDELTELKKLLKGVVSSYKVFKSAEQQRNERFPSITNCPPRA